MLKSCGSNSNFQVDTVIADVHGTDLEVLFKLFLILNSPFDKTMIFHRPYIFNFSCIFGASLNLYHVRPGFG